MKHLNLTEKESYNLIKESVVLAKQAVELYKKQFPNDGIVLVLFIIAKNTLK